MQNNIIWGISAGGHDAAISKITKNGEILWAAHSERYSKIKNDDALNRSFLLRALSGGRSGTPAALLWHEKPFLKRTRELRAGQWHDVFSAGPRSMLNTFGLSHIPLHTVSHHHSHAAGGYYTSGFDNAAVLVVDAIGEWDTTTAWQGSGNDLKKIAAASYPNSLGLFYTAITQRCGFKPNEEEYIVMGLAAFGDPDKYKQLIINELITPLDTWPFYRCHMNMHRGLSVWQENIKDISNLAAAAQAVFTEIMLKISTWLKSTTNSSNLVLSGGCALNCVTNAAVAQTGIWDKIWIMPNPGDAGNSLGAALAYLKQHVEWKGPYLGHDIAGMYPTNALVHQLHKTGVAGVANGQAEFGPRALGNRSLLADPRIPNIQDRLNVVKKREAFRPFAPVILEEYADRYFEMTPYSHAYMQYTVKCRQPDRFPGIVHVDGTSRVQTINVKQHMGLYQTLRRWYSETGCPMLVNTSLNIKGQPMVNDEIDAAAFENEYNIKVYTRS